MTLKAQKHIFTLLVLFWMGMIFWFSAQPSKESEDF